MSSILKHRNGRTKPDDLESGPSTPTSPTHNSDDAPNYDGEEYDVLLRYAKDQAALASKHDDDDDDEGEQQQKRLWYAPWKKVSVKSDKEKKVRFFPPRSCFKLTRLQDPGRMATNQHDARLGGRRRRSAPETVWIQ